MVSSPEIKNISLYPKANQGYMFGHPVPPEGRIMIVTIVGTGRGGRWQCRRRTARERTAKTCGPDARKLASSCAIRFLRSDGGNRASAHRGERVISCKAIAQGRPGVHRCPVCSCALCFVLTARETAGAARTRSSLRPLMRGREVSGKARAQCAARVWTHVLQRHCEEPLRRCNPSIRFAALWIASLRSQ